MTPPQQTMDVNLISPSTFPTYAEVGLLFYFNKIAILLTYFLYIAWLSPFSPRSESPDSSIAMLLFTWAKCLCARRFILLQCRQKATIASRLQTVIEKYIPEMDNLLTLMKRWESRPCRKVNGCRNDEDTKTRLRSFLDAMESLDLTNKIYELKGLSNDLNLVTKRLIRSRLSKAIDLITVWIAGDYLYQVLVSEG